jgi:hypothetical protein
LKYRSLLGLLVSFTIIFQAQSQGEESSLGRDIEIVLTEKYILHSDEIDQDFSISITLPEGYSPENRYPLIIFTDANQNYISNSGAETNVVGLRKLTETLQANGVIPKVVLVGIGYPSRNYRVRDFTPVQVPNQPPNMSGGANEFAIFIETKVKPFVYSKAKIDRADETYIGHSHGGIFGAYVLFNKPGLFNKYVLSSPSFWYGRSPSDNVDGASFIYEEQYSHNNTNMAKSVYISAGSEEGGSMALDAKKMHDILESRDYKSLRLGWMLFEGESHMSVVRSAYTEGLSFIFEGR